MSEKAYIIARIDVTDWDVFREYMKHTPRVIGSFGGRFLARGSDPETLEGEKETHRMVIIEMPDIETARAFHASDDFQRAIRLREKGSSAQLVLVGGYPLESWEADLEASQKLSW